MAFIDLLRAVLEKYPSEAWALSRAELVDDGHETSRFALKGFVRARRYRGMRDGESDVRRTLKRIDRTSRAGDRMRLHAGLSLSTLDGQPVAPFARCTEIGLGGLRASAAEGCSPGTDLWLELRLPAGGHFATRGRVAWSKQTLHPPMFGSPRGRDDDAIFGIAFAPGSPQDFIPIARLFAARDHELRRARRIRRLHGYPIHA